MRLTALRACLVGVHTMSTDSLTFKLCPCCGHRWHDREEFLGDPTCTLIGYQRSFFALESGPFLFNHLAPGCGTTIALPAREFLDFHVGPVFEQNLYGTSECPGHCLNVHDTEPCPSKCECAFVRSVLQTVKTWPKRES